MSWETALDARDDLKDFEGEALGLFGLALRFGVDDLVSVAADAVTDGQNDKKLDIIYIDKPQKIAFLMQCYKAEGKFHKKAPENKATDLHTAVSYAFSVDVGHLPNLIKPQIVALRESIESGDIETIYIWYVHNRTEHQDIDREMKQVEISAQANLKARFPNTSCRVIAQEIGRLTLKDWYDKSSSTIVVDEKIKFHTDDYMQRSGQNWKCIISSVSGRSLYELYSKHNRDLFSLNVRDYLGVVKKDANVNNNIKKTAADDPNNFWAFNNGITAIVNDFELNDDGFTVSGIAIVNGAQTTGVIGNLEAAPSEELYVPARFFKTSDQEMIDSIIKFNNSQNAIEASDFRSTDGVQKRLREEFTAIPNSDYEGGRRGNVSDAIKRRPNLLPSYTVGQALTAFHGDPVLAYNEKSRIWTDNNSYNRIFNDETSAKHIIFCFSLLRSIEIKKSNLHRVARESGQNLQKADADKIEFLRQKGSQFLLMYIASQCLEMICGRAVPNLFRISFKEISIINSIASWDSVLEIFLSFSPKLTNYLSDGLKSNERAKTSAQDFRQTLEAIRAYHSDIYKDFQSKLSFD